MYLPRYLVAVYLCANSTTGQVNCQSPVNLSTCSLFLMGSPGFSQFVYSNSIAFLQEVVS